MTPIDRTGTTVAEEKRTFELRGVVYREGNQWFSHCLELDIVSEGNSPDEAVQNTIELCAYQIDTAIESGDVESIFRPAPAKFWNLFFSKTKKRSVPKRLKNSLQKFEAHELVMT